MLYSTAAVLFVYDYMLIFYQYAPVQPLMGCGYIVICSFLFIQVVCLFVRSVLATHWHTLPHTHTHNRNASIMYHECTLGNHQSAHTTSLFRHGSKPSHYEKFIITPFSRTIPPLPSFFRQVWGAMTQWASAIFAVQGWHVNLNLVTGRSGTFLPHRLSNAIRIRLVYLL